eukprot:1484391-Rhodomonas_salina.1
MPRLPAADAIGAMSWSNKAHTTIRAPDAATSSTDLEICAASPVSKLVDTATSTPTALAARIASSANDLPHHTRVSAVLKHRTPAAVRQLVSPAPSIVNNHEGDPSPPHRPQAPNHAVRQHRVTDNCARQRGVGVPILQRRRRGTVRDDRSVVDRRCERHRPCHRRSSSADDGVPALPIPLDDVVDCDGRSRLRVAEVEDEPKPSWKKLASVRHECVDSL